MSPFDGFPLPPRDEDGDEWVDSDVLNDSGAPWRGDVHLDDWPEHLAGPEYRLKKQELEDGEEGK